MHALRHGAPAISISLTRPRAVAQLCRLVHVVMKLGQKLHGAVAPNSPSRTGPDKSTWAIVLKTTCNAALSTRTLGQIMLPLS